MRLPMLASLLLVISVLAATAVLVIPPTQEESDVHALPSEEGRATDPPPLASGRLEEESILSSSGNELHDVHDLSKIRDRSKVAQLRSLVLESKEDLVAANALRSLGRMVDVARDPELCGLLGSERARLRHEIILALGCCRDAAVLGLLEPLLADSDATSRRLAIQAIGTAGGENGRELLTSLLERRDLSVVDRAFARAALKSSQSLVRRTRDS